MAIKLNLTMDEFDDLSTMTRVGSMSIPSAGATLYYLYSASNAPRQSIYNLLRYVIAECYNLDHLGRVFTDDDWSNLIKLIGVYEVSFSEIESMNNEIIRLMINGLVETYHRRNDILLPKSSIRGYYIAPQGNVSYVER